MAKKKRTYLEEAPKRETVIRYPEYWELINWTATPTPLRRFKTQRELARELSVHEVTLANWKRAEGFDEDVLKEIRKRQRNEMPDILLALKNAIIKKGGAAEVKLWLQWVTEWSEKTTLEHKGEVKTQVGDNEATKELLRQVGKEYEAKLKEILSQKAEEKK